MLSHHQSKPLDYLCFISALNFFLAPKWLCGLLTWRRGLALAHGFVDSGGGGVGDRDVGDGRGETRLLEVAGVWGLGVLAGKKKDG